MVKFKRRRILGVLTDEDRKHCIAFDKLSENLLKNILKQNQKYVKIQLEILNKNFMDYLNYWNEKYYRNGFVDGVQIIGGCINF